MMEQPMKISVEDTALTLAASVVERAHELLADGWTQGTLYEGRDGLPERFCVHGALNLALEEVFGEGTSLGRSHIDGTRMVTSGASDVEALAVAFIVDEAASQFAYQGGGMFLGAARFNDAPERKLDEVLAVIGAASKRLWDLALDSEPSKTWEPSKWAQVDEVATEQFMNVALA